MKMKKDKLQCIWSHQCENRYLCCSECVKKNCDWRCYDNITICIYKQVFQEELIEEPLFEPSITEQLRKEKISRIEITQRDINKLREYKKEKTLTLHNLAKLIEVPDNLIQRVLSSDKPRFKASKATLSKIIDFIDTLNKENNK